MKVLKPFAQISQKFVHRLVSELVVAFAIFRMFRRYEPRLDVGSELVGGQPCMSQCNNPHQAVVMFAFQ